MNITLRWSVASVVAFGLIGVDRVLGQASGVANVTFQWTDRAGTTHVLKRTWTTGVEDDGILGTTPAGTGFTNQFGINVFTGTDLTPLESQTEFRGDVQAFLGDAPGGGGYVAKIGASTAHTYAIDWPLPSGSTFNVGDPPGSASFTYTVDNTTTAGAALGMLQAVDFMRRYYRDAHSLTIPAVDIVWNSTIAGSAYYPSPTFAPERIEIGATDWASWDVIMHEYGHFIANKNNFDGPFGGPHNFGQETINLATPAPGARTSWGEGLATFLGLTAVVDGNINAAIPNLPTKDQDAFYDSFNTPFAVSSQPDNTNVVHRISAENKGGANDTGASGPVLGEGDEMSVLRVLWDVKDGAADGYTVGSDKANFGIADTLSLLTGVDIFEDFWDNLANASILDPTKLGLAVDATEYEVLGTLGEILQEYNVGHAPVDAVKVDATPKLKFVEQNNDNASRHRFVILDENLQFVVDELDFADTAGLNTWFWDVTNPLAPGFYYFAALGNSAIDLGASPATDREWYWSSLDKFEVVPETSALALTFVGLLGIFGTAYRRLRSS